MLLPEVLEPFRKEVKKPTEIIFSGPTYQIACEEEEPVWVFVQLDEEGEVKDLFCQCEQSGQIGGCSHMAQACLAIYSRGEPLHSAFEKSPFFLPFLELSKDEATVTRKGDALYIGELACSGSKELIDRLEKIAVCREEETEETSIKFSNASEEELDNWYKGRISTRLQFELSLYSDIAKFLFLLSEESSYRIDKNMLRYEWPELSCVLPIQCSLEKLLDTLPPRKTIPSLELYGGYTIEKIIPSRKGIEVFFQGKPCLEESPVEDRWFLNGQGSFVRKWDSSHTVLSESSEIESFLNSVFPDTTLCSIQYDIQLDAKKISIVPYIHEKRDLQGSYKWGAWVWNGEFEKIETPRFDRIGYEVSREKVNEFLTTHRYWLQSQKGFEIHERVYEEELSYSVKSSGALVFKRKAIAVENKKRISFEKWEWIESVGFFLRQEATQEKGEITVLPYQVADFIRRKGEWLREISGFFAQKVPVCAVELDIRLVRNRRIDIIPVYKWEDPSYSEKVQFYEDMAYVPELGFFRLPNLLAQSHFTRTLSAVDKESWERFFNEELDALKQEYSCRCDSRLERPKKLALFCQDLETDEIVEMEGLSGKSIPREWAASFYWESETGRVRAEEVFNALKRGDRFFPSEAGLLDVHDQRFGWLATVKMPLSGKKFSLHTADFLKIHAHEEVSFDKGVSIGLSTIVEKLFNEVPEVPPDLSSFKATLRSYQQQGVEWLWYLYLAGLSGLLCDDMGVGKTYQAMALLQAVRNRKGKPGKFLIICPTSLIWHWRDKCRAVLPECSIFAYVGSSRSLDDFTHEIFLTTYGVWRNEVKKLKDIAFDVAIFDELQLAKNHVSRIWAALSLVNASMRLGLTGTPVENQTRELKALFDLILPGYFPSDRQFRQHYVRPIEKNSSQDRRKLLARYVRPFILRRRKEDVLPSLPQKTEDIYEAELVGEQKTLYRQVASRQGQPLIQQLQESSSPIPYLHIFSLLSSLKQICNHPAAYLNDVEHYRRYECGKWDVCCELLEEARESGQKVVIFSQFLAMLDIFKLFFKSGGIGYSEIRGSTKDRGAAIEKFHVDPECTVFLGSLQAAGLGIDLTPASIVIHYDRWWNAARENQATDRVHRMGQSRGVCVYKLMTVKSIEERIDQIISKKDRLFEELIQYDDHRIVKKLSRHELIDLLRGLDSV